MKTNQFRQLILGDFPYIPSSAAYKRVILTGILSAITILISITFLILDLTTKNTSTQLIHVFCILIALLCFILNRKGYHAQSKILLGITVNVAIYLFSESEPSEIGLYLFFLVTSVAAIAAFGNEEVWFTIFFVSLSLVLFLLSLYTDLGMFPKVEGTPDYIQLNIFINFIIALSATAIIVFFVVNLNYRSEKALHENELQITAKNDELIRLNTELDRFVYSTSHDLRSPISSIRGLINLSRMSKNPAEADGYLGMMEDQLLKLSNFIKDIADYSRNTRLELNVQEIVVRNMVDDVLESMKFIPGSEKIKTEIEIPEGLLVMTDPSRLHMILSNLISNSYKYADNYKEASFIRIGAKRNEMVFQLQVTDNGMGIDHRYIDRVFDMFFQAHTKAEGSGLGLYIVKEAVSKIGGRISVRSTLGESTQFQVEIPQTINSKNSI